MEGLSEDDQSLNRIDMDEGQKYSMLVVGYKCYPGHLADYIRNLKKVNPSVDISLVTTRDLCEMTEDLVRNTSHIFRIRLYGGKGAFVRKMVDVLRIVRFFARLSLTHRYDFVNIHYPIPRISHVIPWMKRMTDHLMITPWGSDVLRVDASYAIERMRRIYDAASCVMVDPDTQLGVEIKTKFKCSPAKILQIAWGMEYVDFIQKENPTETVDESKERFGLNGKYVITCGYNSRLEQRHNAIIDAIAKIKDNLPKNLILLFPFTYGKQPWMGYSRSLLERCSENGLTGMVINEFLSYRDLYMLRNATDMFVHVQTTDAASSCVMQYILCNKKIVHGSWIKYNDLERVQPRFFFPVERMEDLDRVILSAYQSDKIVFSQELIDLIMSRGWTERMKKLNAYCESVLNRQ